MDCLVAFGLECRTVLAFFFQLGVEHGGLLAEFFGFLAEVGVDVFQFALGFRLDLGEPGEDLLQGRIGKLCDHGSFAPQSGAPHKAQETGRGTGGCWLE